MNILTDITVATVGLGNQPLICYNQQHRCGTAARACIETRASNESPATGHPVCLRLAPRLGTC